MKSTVINKTEAQILLVALAFYSVFHHHEAEVSADDEAVEAQLLTFRSVLTKNLEGNCAPIHNLTEKITFLADADLSSISIL